MAIMYNTEKVTGLVWLITFLQHYVVHLRYCSCHDLSLKPDTANSVCFFNVVNGTQVCANNRSGRLCGKCQDDYTVGIQTFRCVKKKKSTACICTTVFSFIFTTLLVILILYFNPGLDNELRGPLFFFQVLPLFFPPVSTKATNSIDVYNLVFFLASIFDFTLPFFGCFFSACYILDDLDNLDMLAMSYSSSAIALIVFLLAEFLTYKHVIFIRRKNAVQCFWVLLMLVYSSLMTTSLRIIDCLLIQGKPYLFLQATLPCYEGKHTGWAIVAYIFLTAGIIIPTLIVVVTKTNLLKIAPHYLDTLTNKLKEERVFWWSVDLLRRFVIVALGVRIHIRVEKQVYTYIYSLEFYQVQKFH